MAGVRGAALAAVLGVGGCGSLFGSRTPPEGQPGHVAGFLGAVVADEPEAALIGRQVLSSGGNAADAAVAVGMALAATLPSRAGLGGGGACLAFAPGRSSVNRGVPEAISVRSGSFDGGGRGSSGVVANADPRHVPAARALRDW